MKIDVFQHIIPPRSKDALLAKLPPTTVWHKFLAKVPTLSDLETRFRIMDRYEGLRQVLTLAGPPLETLFEGRDLIEMARITNDEMAELVRKYPDRFVAAAASLPVTDMDAALEELDRAVKDLGCRGIQLYTSVNGKPLDLPEFTPLYRKMEAYDLPILLHPTRERPGPDYRTEEESKYLISSLFGREYETAAAATRLVFGGVFERYPNLTVITHHFGGMISYMEKRIDGLYDFHEKVMGERFSENLSRRPIDYYHLLYCDTAYGSTPGLTCACAFFGVDRVLFATDMPYDSELGNRKIRETIASIEGMAIAERQKEQIFEGNAVRLFKLGRQ